MSDQYETLPQAVEDEIEQALDELRSVQFCDNTYTQAVEARDEVEQIIRRLAKRLAKGGELLDLVSNYLKDAERVYTQPPEMVVRWFLSYAHSFRKLQKGGEE